MYHHMPTTTTYDLEFPQKKKKEKKNQENTGTRDYYVATSRVDQTVGIIISENRSSPFETGSLNLLINKVITPGAGGDINLGLSLSG